MRAAKLCGVSLCFRWRDIRWGSLLEAVALVIGVRANTSSYLNGALT